MRRARGRNKFGAQWQGSARTKATEFIGPRSDGRDGTVHTHEHARSTNGRDQANGPAMETPKIQ